MADVASVLHRLNLEIYKSGAYHPPDRLCCYFARVLAERLRNEDIPCKILSVDKRCVHAMVAVETEQPFTCDPTAGVVYPYDIEELVRSPDLGCVTDFPPTDDHWRDWVQRAFAGPRFFGRVVAWRKD